MVDIREKLQQEWSSIGTNYLKNKGDRFIYNIFQRVGKIRTTLLTISKLDKRNHKILVTYPDNSIRESWEKDIIKFGFEHLNITYSNHMSLDKYTEEKWDILVADECHTINSDERVKNTQILINNSKHIIMLSGTITDEKRNELKLLFDIEPLIVYTKKEAIEDSIVADYQIEVRIVELDDIIKTKNSKGKLITEKQRYKNLTYVIEKINPSPIMIFNRNKLLQQSIAKQNEIKKCLKELKNQRVIVFTGYAKTAEKLEIPYFHSKVKDKTVVDRFNDQEFNHLALAVKGSIGATYKDLDCVILSNFVTDSAKNEQGFTRSSIKDYGNKVSKFIIICTNTPAELKKLNKTLIEFDDNKIYYK